MKSMVQFKMSLSMLKHIPLVFCLYFTHHISSAMQLEPEWICSRFDSWCFIHKDQSAGNLMRERIKCKLKCISQCVFCNA